MSAQAAAELDSENLKYEQNLPLGGMIELPAAVASIGDLVQILDFFSIGTNDLVQYTLAVDRTNARVSRWWEECHPAVLRLIAQTVKRVREAGKGISVCGEWRVAHMARFHRHRLLCTLHGCRSYSRHERMRSQAQC